MFFDRVQQHTLLSLLLDAPLLVHVLRGHVGYAEPGRRPRLGGITPGQQREVAALLIPVADHTYVVRDHTHTHTTAG